jgi:hypothetical protein
LAAVFDEGIEVGELPELLAVDGGFGAVGQRIADLGDHHADLPGRDLHPGVFLHGVEKAELETDARHEQFGLVAGFALEGDGVVVGQAPVREAARYKAHFRGADAMQG